jgi:hypothetical protein
MISERLGYQYHTAEIASVENARVVYKVVKDIKHYLENRKDKKPEDQTNDEWLSDYENHVPFSKLENEND